MNRARTMAFPVPRQAVAAVAGLGGMCGLFGASLFRVVVGCAARG